MTSDWRQFCKLARYEVKGEIVRVHLDDGRVQRVRVRDDADEWKLETTVARRGLVAELHELRLLVWRRNRAVDLLGFRVDEDKRIFGEARLPKVGTTVKEFRVVLDVVARESDRMEYLLTGRDIE